MAGSRQYVFGEFRLDARQRALFRQQELVALTPKSLETLLFLVERHGQIVDKKELLEAVWPDTFVEEVSLARNVSLLRKALSDHQDGHAFIETIPKRGYRFVAPVEIEDLPLGQTELTPISEPHALKPGILLPRRIPSFRRKWVLTLAVVGICVSVLAWIYPRPWPASRPPLIVVLPVQNLTGDATREYVADGLTEELIARLGSRLGQTGRDRPHLRNVLQKLEQNRGAGQPRTRRKLCDRKQRASMGRPRAHHGPAHPGAG